MPSGNVYLNKRMFEKRKLDLKQLVNSCLIRFLKNVSNEYVVAPTYSLRRRLKNSCSKRDKRTTPSAPMPFSHKNPIVDALLITAVRAFGNKAIEGKWLLIHGHKKDVMI